MSEHNLKRRDYFYQKKQRDSKRWFVTEIENLYVLVAWQAGVLSEGQSAKRLGLDRVSLRMLRDQAIQKATQ